MYLGEFQKGQTVRFCWNTFDSLGASIARGTNGTVQVHEDGGLTQFTTGVTDTEDYDGLAGVNQCVIDTSLSEYERGKEYFVILNGAVIDGRTVNAVLAHFCIENRFNPAAPKKNTAYIFNVLIRDSTNPKAGKTGLTLTSQVSKDGAAFASIAGSVTEIANGIYKISAAAADMNADAVVFKFTATGAVDTFEEFLTRP